MLEMRYICIQDNETCSTRSTRKRNLQYPSHNSDHFLCVTRDISEVLMREKALADAPHIRSSIIEKRESA